MEQGQQPPPDPKDLIDPKVIIGWTLLALRFLNRRKWIPISLALVMAGLAIGALKVIPKTYESSVTLHAKKSEYLSPDRDGRLTDDADVLLHRREVLADMVERTNLVKEWKARRSPLFRLKDSLYGMLIGVTSDKDLGAIMEAKLNDQLTVATEGDTVTITVSWTDPEIAARLASAAQQAFLEERRVQEVGLLAESMEILRKHSATLEKEITDEISKARALVLEKNKAVKAENAQKMADANKKLASQPRAAAAPPSLVDAPTAPVVSDADLSRIAALETQIKTKEAALANLINASGSAIVELQAKLAQARAIYKEAHPVVADLKQQVQAAQAEPPMAGQLRSEIANLESERAALGGTGTVSSGASRARAVRGPALGAGALAALKEVEEFEITDPDIDYARSKISWAMRKYSDIQFKLDEGHLNLETAQAAFRHRYRVVTPAEVPNKATKPEPAKVILGAVFGGLAFGVLLVLFLEFRHGLIYESWQVESSLGLPIVADIEISVTPQRLR